MMKGIVSGMKHFWRMDAMGVAILAGVTVAAYGLQIHPLIRARQNVIAQSASLHTQQQKVVDLRGSLQSLKEQLAAAQRAVAEDDLQLQPSSRLNQQIGKLTDLAIEDGILIESVEPGKTTSAARYGTIDVRVTGFGSYRNCATFLRHLNEKYRDSSVGKVQLSTQASAVTNSASFTLDLTWYTAPEALSSTR